MELPDCPPGAEGYEDTVLEAPKKHGPEDGDCTKAEQEFQDHLNSLKIKVENEGPRCMVERRGRDVSGKWIYLCYPCAAVCSGESILQTHISGKKHKTKLSMKNVWPQSIFEEHPYVLSEKGLTKEKGKDTATEKVLQKMAEEVNLHNNSSELAMKYNKYRNVACHIQDSLDNIKAPLVGVEYLVEHPPEQAHYEPSYMCTLCHKQGHPRTIINHLTCFWHRYNYLSLHYTKAVLLLSPYRSQNIYREGVNVIINRLTQRIVDTYGQLKPVNIDKEEYERDRDLIHQWIYKGYHFSEKIGPSFEEVVDTGLIESLHKSNTEGKRFDRDKKDPSPPVVAAPTKPLFNNYTRPAGRQERRPSADALSDISDEPDPRRRDTVARPQGAGHRYDPYRGRQESPGRSHRFTNKSKTATEKLQEKVKPANYDYKQKLALEQTKRAEEAAKKTLAYHEKNPEKHPLYPEEWKKFWNRRYKEIQAEGKDPSKHDFKPEWIQYWTARMKVLHEEELRVVVSEFYRKMCLPLPDELEEKKPPVEEKERRRSPEPRRRSPDPRRRSPDPRRRSPDPRRRSPDPRRRSPLPRRRSPDQRRRSPIPRRRTPERRRSPLSDRYRLRKEDDRNRRDMNRSPPRRYGDRPEPPRPDHRHRSRSPVHSRTRSPPGAAGDAGAGARTHIELESTRRSRSPLSRRPATRNRSPRPDLAPSLQTVLISDDELKPDDGLSPWNSDNDDSLGSLPEARSPTRSHAGSEMSRASRPRQNYSRPADPSDLGPPENVVATLRLLVALEDYLGSLGPKVVDLLTEALRMEKDKANTSEELLDRESAVALMETAKEKLKGAVQAGLVPAAATPAVRAAVVRVAATLHAADKRLHKQKSNASQKTSGGPSGVSMPVVGVGEVDRAQIAQQMAAALIAQGKTDVSSEELAQLVDAVVGMAEAKKREAEVKMKVEARAASRQPRPAAAPAQGKTASALQMLQSAYDENEKRIEKEDAPDAMDGLSDSDLETLLKNFNELSAEEQHSLIAYLKKLEAREPQRVEKLRQYVSAAAAPATAPASTSAPTPPAAPAPAAPASAPAPARADGPVTIESDDDDYAVEEVFQSATQKVKEDQIRQEMEIVKKSLEESTKAVPTIAETAKTASLEMNSTSSATDLLALVQASLQTAAAGAPAGVVSSRTQPRSFGDAPDAPPSDDRPTDLLAAFLSNQAPPQPVWTPREPSPQSSRSPFAQETRGSTPQDSRPFGQDDDSRADARPFGQDNRGQFNQDDRGQFNQERGFGSSSGQFGQDSRGGFNQDSRGPFNQDNIGGAFNQDNRGPPFNQDNRAGNNQDNRGGFNQDNQGGFNQGNQGGFNQGNQGGFNPGNQGGFNSGNQGGFNLGNRRPFNQDNRGPFNQDSRGPFNQDNRAPLLPDNPGAASQNNRFPMQNNRGPMGQDNRTGFGQDNRPAPFNNFGQDNMNRGNNFMNGMQDQAQFGNQQNFRGRGGRGRHMRGRGRGFY